MKNRLPFLLLAVLISSKCFAQVPVLQWAKGFGAQSDDYANSITVDVLGNTYTVGSFKGIADFDPGRATANLTNSGGSDIFLIKLDAAGAFVWAKGIGGKGNDEAYAVTTDVAGSIYLSGSFEGTVDFNTGQGINNLIAAGVSDAFVLKLDANGNFLWAKSFGGNADDVATGISVDAAGNVFACGVFKNDADFDPGAGLSRLSSAGMSDAFVLKLDAAGVFVWAKRLGGNMEDYASSIAADLSGNIYTLGNFSGTADFDPGMAVSSVSSMGLNDIFLSKLDAEGKFLNVQQFGGVLEDNGADLALDGRGNIFISGQFTDVVDFQPGPNVSQLSALGGSDAFVLKMDQEGTISWVEQMGGLFDDNVNSIAVDPNGNVFVAGAFHGIADFDPGTYSSNLSSVGMADAFIAKLNFNGNFMWARNTGSASDDYANSVAVSPMGNVVLCGVYSEKADFDPGMDFFEMTSAGGMDFFIQNIIEAAPTDNRMLFTDLTPFPNPGPGVYSYKLNAPCTVQIMNANGVMVYNGVGTVGFNKIDISNQERGMYYLKLIAADEKATQDETLVKY